MAKSKDAFGSSVSATIDNTIVSAGLRRPPVPPTKAVGDALAARPAKILEVAASDCFLWEQHNRREPLTQENCQDLIDGILAQGGIEFPLIVRDNRQASGERFEIICGARRFFSVKWLNANNHPEIRLKVEVRILTDEEAFRVADVENGPREDVSPYERGLDYRRALNDFYAGSQSAMAKRREISQQTISNFLKLAEVPEWVLPAYPRWSDLKVHHAQPILECLAKNDGEGRLRAAVQYLQTLHVENRSAGRKPMPGARVLSTLTAAVSDAEKKSKQELRVYQDSEGRPTITVRNQNRNQLQLVVHAGPEASRKELVKSFREALDEFA